MCKEVTSNAGCIDEIRPYETYRKDDLATVRLGYRET